VHKARPRKLVYILNQYSDDEAGHFFHVFALLEQLAERGVEIALVIEKCSGKPPVHHPRIAVHLVNRRDPLTRSVKLLGVMLSLIRKGYSKTFVRIAAPAAIIATLAHRILGGQTYLWQSGTTLEFDSGQPLTRDKLKWMVTSYLPNVVARRCVDYFVTGPSFMLDYYEKVAKVRRDKMRLLYNDIEIERFARPMDSDQRRAKFLASHGIPGDRRILLLVHRLSPVRRTQLYFPQCLEYLRAHQMARDILVVVAGAGSELPHIRAEAERLGVGPQCLFLGSVPNRDIHRLYGIAEIFLHPTYNEGFPRVILEAMAAGLPIVTTDAGGTAELLGPLQKQFVKDRTKPLEFAAALGALLQDTAVRANLAMENRAQVEKYSTANVARMYEEVLFA
jgi:glycosyltransferase involved in cell wall biosynthesis